MARQQDVIQKNEYNHIKLTVITIFAVIAAVFSVMTYFSNTSEQAVLKALNTMEAYKVGGKENWNKLQTLYNSSDFSDAQKQQIDAALESLGAIDPNTPEAGTPDIENTDTSDTLSDKQLASILDDAPLLGNEKSDIVLLEYSDFECVFCQKEFDNGIVDSLLDSDNIAYSMKQFPIVSIHPDAQKSAEGALCVRNLAGDDAFFKYRDAIFTSKDSSIANITQVASSLGVNETEFTECLDSNKMASQVAAEMNEGQSLFGINGTPGNVLINKKTGKFVVISGAQPITAFQNGLKQIQ